RRTPYHRARHDDVHDLVGAFEDLVNPEIANDLFDAEIGEIAVAAMQLQRIVGDLEAAVRHHTYRHGAERGRVIRLLLQRRRGPPQEGPAYFQVRGHIRKRELQRLEARERLAKGLSLLHVG